MALLHRTAALFRAPVTTPVASAARRAFSTSNVRALKETDRDTNPQQAEENEKHKQDTIRKSKEGKGHWKPELATNSEEAVKADRSSAENGDSPSIAELQKRSTEHVEKKRKSGTSEDDGL